MRTRTRSRILTSVVISAALLVTLPALPANAAGPDDYYAADFSTPGSVASTAGAARLPGWALPSGTSQDGSITADGTFQLSNAGRVPGFSHGGYTTPALGQTAGETGVGDVNTFDVGFTLGSATSGYQEGLSVGVTLDDAARDWSRYGGLVWFMHQDDVLKIGSFWLDPALNTGSRPLASASIVWTEQVIGTYDPAVAHDIRLVGTYVDGLGNDTIDVYVDGELAGTVGTFEGYAEVKNQAPSPVGSLGFFFGPNTTSSAGLTVFSTTARVAGLAGAGFEFSNLVLRSYDVDLTPPAAPTTLPPLVETPDGTLELPPSATETGVVPGGEIEATGTGFDPFETVLFTVHSTPQFLGWAQADLNGNVRATFTLPSGLAPGTHTVQAVGQRSARVVTSPVLVTLPDTGPESAPVTGGLIALGALVGGLLLMSASRRPVRSV